MDAEPGLGVVLEGTRCTYANAQCREGRLRLAAHQIEGVGDRRGEGYAGICRAGEARRGVDPRRPARADRQRGPRAAVRVPGDLPRQARAVSEVAAAVRWNARHATL